MVRTLQSERTKQSDNDPLAAQSLSTDDFPTIKSSELVRPKKRAFYPALDGMRAVAFTMVFLRHYLHLPWGWAGVNLFFVLSGFLITGILVDTKDEPHRARNFYVRRTLRIFPLYYGIFLALLLLAPLMHWQWTSIWIAWPLYLGNFLRFLNPTSTVLGSPLEHAADGWLIIGRIPRASLLLGHFWSLCVEEQFYLAWPWIVFLTKSRSKLISLCVVTVLMVPVARIVLFHTAPAWMIREELLYRFTPLQLDSLLLGALVALLWRGANRQMLLRLASVLTPLMLVVACVYVAIQLPVSSIQGFFQYTYPPWEFSLGLCFINFFAVSLLLCCLKGQGLFYSVLNLRPLRWVGRISYGAYVFHDIFHDFYTHLAIQLSRHWWFANSSLLLLTALLGYASTLLIAALSFRFFETPFLRLKERLTIHA